MKCVSFSLLRCSCCLLLVDLLMLCTFFYYWNFLFKETHFFVELFYYSPFFLSTTSVPLLMWLHYFLYLGFLFEISARFSSFYHCIVFLLPKFLFLCCFFSNPSSINFFFKQCYTQKLHECYQKKLKLGYTSLEGVKRYKLQDIVYFTVLVKAFQSSYHPKCQELLLLFIQ